MSVRLKINMDIELPDHWISEDDFLGMADNIENINIAMRELIWEDIDFFLTDTNLVNRIEFYIKRAEE